MGSIEDRGAMARAVKRIVRGGWRELGWVLVMEELRDTVSFPFRPVMFLLIASTDRGMPFPSITAVQRLSTVRR
jgi:hypothetical protein